MREKLSLYVHIPFCGSKCYYCSFVSFVSDEDTKIQYIDALIKEIHMRAREYRGKFDVSTIYIGGGTPSCLPTGLIKKIISEIYKGFNVDNNAEITLEVNPGTVNALKIEEYLQCGVNRFSIGLQSSDDKLLSTIGRKHDVFSYELLVTMLRNKGLSNISTDIMLGLPTQTEKNVEDTVNLIVDLKIPHISSYMLMLDSDCKIKSMIENKELNAMSEDEMASLYEKVVNILTTRGYERYEVSNFCLPGFRSKHNSVYWDRKNYLGLGLAAHSFIVPFRMANTENLSEYVNLINANKFPISQIDEIDEKSAKEETIMLSLRKLEGLNTEQFLIDFKENILASKKEKILSFMQGGFLTLDSKGFLKATSKGFLVLNKIILELCE